MAFGDPKPEGGSNKGAEGILTQIKGLLNQYQALGPETPLSEESKAFEADVDTALDRLKSGEGEAAEAGMPSESETSSPSDFRTATQNAREVFERNGSSDGGGGTKTDEEQSPDEDNKKKRSKAY